MDTLPEQNKLFACQNPDCGKESCRLCKEFSHIPLRCEEVEKDAEVRKRTYIEKKMTEAMIRNCWKCQKPFVKADGCNKMTCDCGASMCYLCRQPVKDYKHFFGQGGVAQPGQTCPLWSDNNSIHERDVARGALEAKSEMDKENPEVKLKHDPAAGINLEQAAAGMQEPNPKKRKINLPNAQLPPGLVGVLPDNLAERQRLIREQEHIEAVIRGGARGLNPFAPPPHQGPPPFGVFNAYPPGQGPPPPDFNNAMLNNVMAREQQLEQIHQQQLQRMQQQQQQRQEQLQQQQLQRLQERQQQQQLQRLQQLQRAQQLQLEQQQFQQQLQEQKQERDEKARMQREAYERKRAMAQYKKSNPKKR